MSWRGRQAAEATSYILKLKRWRHFPPMAWLRPRLWAGALAMTREGYSRVSKGGEE